MKNDLIEHTGDAYMIFFFCVETIRLCEAAADFVWRVMRRNIAVYSDSFMLMSFAAMTFAETLVYATAVHANELRACEAMNKWFCSSPRQTLDRSCLAKRVESCFEQTR